VKRLQTILPARWKLKSVPVTATANKNPVESTHHQLVAVESTAYGLVAKISSLPVLKRTLLNYSNCSSRYSAFSRSLSRITFQRHIFFYGGFKQNGARTFQSTFQSAAIVERPTAPKNSATPFFWTICGLESPRSVLVTAMIVSPCRPCAARSMPINDPGVAIRRCNFFVPA